MTNPFSTTLILIAVTVLSNIGFGQTIVTLQPDGIDGLDAQIDSRVPSVNSSTHQDFMAHDWTNQGVPTTGRALLDFDLSMIPDSVNIISAHLSLYGVLSPHGNGTHSDLSGDNSCVIQMITSPWDEQTVTWNNQPNTSSQYEQRLDGPVSQIQDFLDIDVTPIVELMLDDSSNCYGFMMRLVNEEAYRRMVFASSDSDDPTKRPKLVIVYEENGTGGGTGGGVNIEAPGLEAELPDFDDEPTETIEEPLPEAGYVSMPNIFTPNGDGRNDIFHAIDFENIQQADLLLFNRWGQVVYHTNDLSTGWDGTIRGQNALEGTYIYKLNYVDLIGNETTLNGTFQLVK